MSTQQDIYAAGSENRPPMLNKEKYVPWSSRLLSYAKSRPNGKLIYNSIINGPYVRRMIPEPGDQNRKVRVNKNFHEQTDDELTEKELKQVKSDNQAIQTILLGLLEDIYAAVDSYDIRAERLVKTHDPLALMENSNNPFNYPVFQQDQEVSSTYMQQPHPNNNYNPQPSFNQNYMQQPMPNPEDNTDPTTTINMILVLMAKAFKLNYSTPTNNNQRISSNPRNRQIAQPGMNMGQDRQMQMVGGNVQNPGVQNVRNQNGLIVVLGITNQNPNGNGNVTQLLIARKEEAGIQLQAEEFDLMADALDLDEIDEVNANYILMANFQQASTSSTQTDKAIVYDSDGSAEVHHYDNCYNNDIFNMFTQKEQYTEPLEPIHEPHQVQQNDSNVIFEVSSIEQGGRIVDQHPETVEETHAYFEPLYNNLAIEVEKSTRSITKKCFTKKINSLHLSSDKQITTLNEEISYLNNQLLKEKSTVSSLLEEKKKLKSDFKIREDEILDKQIQLENKIKELDNILVKTGQSIQTMHMLSPKPHSFYYTEQKMALGYQNPFYLKQAQQKQQSLYNGKVLLEKHDPPAVYDSEETLQLAQESRLKRKQLNKEIKPANYTKINHLSGVFVSQTAKSREELYLSNTSKTANVSKSFSIPNEEFSDDTTPSVAQKFLNEVKSTIVTLQRVVKQKMTLDIHNWSSSAHQEIHKIVKDEIFPIVNQVDARVQNFKIQFLKEAAKFVRDFKSLAKEADESLAKHKDLELEIERLLRAVVSQDIMSIMKSNSVVPQKVDETNDLSNPVTSNSVPTPQESKVVKNNNVIAPKMFRINPSKTSREDKCVPINKVRASVRINLITVSQPHVITKNYVNSDSHGLSSTQVDNTAKTKWPQPGSNTKNDRVPSVSKSSCVKNKEVEVEEHHRNLLLSKNKKPMSSECNNIKLSIHNDKSEVVCAMCHSNMFMVHRLGMLKAHDKQSEASHKFRLEVPGNRSL
ncbi:hypothetical protein Tco_1173793 [Tanacetum coccineum]